MKNISAKSIFMKLVFVLPFILLVGCDELSVPEETEQVFKSTDLELLPKFISLPRQPLSAKWEVVEIQGRDNGTLTALLEFTANDKRYVLQHSQAFDLQLNIRLDAGFYDAWLPAAAKAGVTVRQQEERYELLGLVPMQANLFTNAALSPYVNGQIAPLANGFILVFLYAM